MSRMIRFERKASVLVESANVHPENGRATLLYLSLGFKPVINFVASGKGAFLYMEFKPVTIQSP